MSTVVLLYDSASLRVDDLPALAAAHKTGSAIVPLFVWDTAADRHLALGGAARWWLDAALRDLDAALAALGCRLILRAGPLVETVAAVVQEAGAGAVFCTRAVEPALAAVQKHLHDRLEASAVPVKRYPGRLLFEPEQIATAEGRPYTVFSPFWRNGLAQPLPPPPIATPARLAAPDEWPESLSVDALNLRPCRPDWAGGLRSTWTATRHAGLTRLGQFLAGPVRDYKANRDRLDRDGTSALSPYLRFGQLSAREVLHAAYSAAEAEPAFDTGVRKFVAELGWREFSAHLLHHFPDMGRAPLRANFSAFPWQSGDSETLRRWQKGLTGFPVVDAGMRQLWQTGWMHNRARMIAASFLVKELLWHWHDGEAWFWDTLVDADAATNAASWQWAAGCGADAAPYFRIFNPILQGEKFDPEGDYVRRYVPELARLPAKLIHQPWTAGPLVLQEAGVKLGTTYPEPIVDRAEARARALAAFEAVKAKPGRLESP